MSLDQSLVLFRPSTPSALSSTSASRSLALSSRLFTQSTGTAIATELLYRLLWDILNRLLTHLHRFAAERLDKLGSFIERVAKERQEMRDSGGKGNEKLEIVTEVSKMAHDSGFVTCPMTGKELGGRRGPPKPPKWVVNMMKGSEARKNEEPEF